jgi:hypothetical protein
MRGNYSTNVRRTRLLHAAGFQEIKPLTFQYHLNYSSNFISQFKKVSVASSRAESDVEGDSRTIFNKRQAFHISSNFRLKYIPLLPPLVSILRQISLVHVILCNSCVTYLSNILPSKPGSPSGHLPADFRTIFYAFSSSPLHIASQSSWFENAIIFDEEHNSRS